jgi:hypothetical protein
MTEERLYGLLPAFYRNRDAEAGEPLRVLCAILDTQLQGVEAEIAGLYENWFIETCAEWVVPYIGDVLRTQPLNAVPAAGFSARPFVARTLSYRRGKGTLTALAGLARDVTGWPAHVVEYFGLCSTTEFLNHLRSSPGDTIDVRDAQRLELLGGPFEQAPYTVDVRAIDARRGRYNLPNLGIAFWRLQAYPVVAATARAVAQPADGRYHVSPLGIEAPLFNQPGSIPTAGILRQRDVPAPLRRRPLAAELEALRRAFVDGVQPSFAYFAAPATFALMVAGTAVPPEQLLICDIEDDPVNVADWLRPPASKSYVPAAGGAPVDRPIGASLDPVRGRLAFPHGATPAGPIVLNYSYGFSGDTGGGPYDRASSLSGLFAETVTWQVAVGSSLTKVPGNTYSTLSDAIADWNAAPTAFGIIAIVDSATYAEQLTGTAAITVPGNCRLLIVAAQWPQVGGNAPAAPAQLVPSGVRPHLHGSLEVQGTTAAAGTPLGELIVNGLTIEGTVNVRAGDLGSLQLMHSTIVPAATGMTVAAGAQAGQENATLSLTLVRSVCGPIVFPSDTLESRALTVSDSIVASDSAGDAASVAIAAGNATGSIGGTTVFGQASIAALGATNSIFTGTLAVARRQSGCIRFSYLKAGSQTPRRYRCQPDTALQGVTDSGEQANVGARLTPRFSSVSCGQPDYAQLARDCAAEIATGADDGSEMGAFSFLQQPQRAANLAASLDEYLRFGLNAGITYVT